MIKILKAKAHPDRKIEVEYNDGIKGSFVFSDFFNYEGIMSPLEDIHYFTQMNTDHKTIKWGNDIDLCPDIIRSIISNEKILHDGKVVFDPALKKNGWMSS